MSLLTRYTQYFENHRFDWANCLKILDCLIVDWIADIELQLFLQAFPGHRGPVSCLAFRQGTSELFSGSFDRTIKIWNVEDRTYMNTLFGHQSEVLSIDCLRKERVLTAGRDRSMQLFKVIL